MAWLTSLLVLAVAAGGVPSAESIADQVRTELQARLQAQGSTADVSVAAVRLQSLPAGEVRFEVGDVAGRWPRARASVPLRVHVNDRLLRTLSVPVTARDMRPALVFEADYVARTNVDAIALQHSEVDMACRTGRVILERPVHSYRLRQDVRAGTPLTDALMEPTPEVQGMQNVELQVHHRGIALSAPAVALQDGRLGERIPVRPSYASEAVVATVTAPGKVQIHD
ncbi:flagella basal body P-ring formation protein FlgA [Stenotrophomonas sp. SPM]|uniref:flagellar basal body P-ring formation chaperone FlgA n=1 Tax=Stenotrophomonas sp. SPM TaxID=2170735 RepID=UPI000DE5F88B|nr:flagellar basal body P-ring formation chaperone FlgA [Stenotrophomonas sp. SPM]PWB29847.1 flagella basal body P-ring formation protein FlgA [Stenotrophomonas sp. SPM]